jgi:soluble lytic murein transglycosylase
MTGFLKRKNSIGLWAAILFFSSVMPVCADIYMYIDNEGTMHFTNAPTSSDFRVYVKERPKKKIKSRSTKQYDHIISQAAQKYGVSAPLVKAIIKAESNYDHRAVSKKGAMGLMQIMPQNFKLCNIDDPFNPDQNINGGTLYFKKMLERFDGKLPLALAAYNAGPNAVDRHKSIPPIKETKEYVKRVMKYYSVYKN